MAEEFDPEAYLDAKLGGDPPPSDPPSAPPPPPKSDDSDSKKKDKKKDRSRSRSKEKRRSRSRDRRRSRSRDRDRDRGHRGERGERGDRYERHDRDYSYRDSRHRGGYGGGGGRYDENYRFERDVPDRLPAEQIAKDEEGFDRDLRTVFIAQVARKADERDLFQFFSECGKVLDVRIIKDSVTRRSKGIAYVEFEKQEMCVAAVTKSGQSVCGFPCVVQASQAEKNQAARLAAQAAAEQELPAKVSVENLHVDIGEDDLSALFAAFGTVNSTKINKEGGRSLGFGHVEFKSLADAQKAVSHLNGFDLAGQSLKVAVMAQSAPSLLGAVGPATEALDDNEVGGVNITSHSRAQLMAKLARDTQMPSLPAPAMPLPGMPGPGMGAGPGPGPTAAIPAGQSAASPFLLLANMFDPATEKEPDFHLDIQEDVKEECEGKFGKVMLIGADRAHPLGLVYIQFDTIDNASKAQQGLNGRYFAGKQILAQFMSAQSFETNLP